MEPEESRYDRGLATMKTIFGSGIESALESLAATSPDLARYLVEFPFADIYSRPGLDLKTREMLTVTALTVLGYPQAELKEHIQGALKVGCTREEILEIHPANGRLRRLPSSAGSRQNSGLCIHNG
jgi:4-carboxymuconolactone decarboxylase